MVGVDNSLSPPGLASRLFWITVSSAELFCELFSVLFGVSFGVVKLDLSPELSFFAKFFRALPDFFWCGAGVLWAGPCGVVCAGWYGLRGLPDGIKSEACGLNGVGRLVWMDLYGACWGGCELEDGW